MSASVKVGDIITNKKPLVILHPTDSVGHALATLTESNISGAPVQDGDRFMGFIDVLDLVQWLFTVVQKPMQSRVTPVSTSIKNDDLDMIIQRGYTFQLRSLAEAKLMNASKRDPFITVRASEPLQNAIAMFGTGIHRVAVTDEENRVYNILTQSDVIHFFADYAEPRLGSLAMASVADLGWAKKALCTVTADTPLIDALSKMHMLKLSAVAVVDDSGSMVENLSASDIKGIRSTTFRRLLLPVGEFLKIRREEQPQGRVAHSRLVWVIETTPLKTVVRKIQQEKVHRVYVLDKLHRPVGVISLTDILAALT